jgi:protein-S-isoprenylcysteine O-methyltransferase Ste14
MDHRRDVSRDHAGVVVPPPLFYIVFFLAGVGLQRYVPLPRLPSVAGRIAGILLALGWLGITVWSVRRFWATGTSVIPIRPTTALVVEGPYRFTRNPMYLGLALLYAGIACWFGLVWPLLLVPGLVWVIGAWVIEREERYLSRKFGQAYRAYQASVRRWL